MFSSFSSTAGTTTGETLQITLFGGAGDTGTNGQRRSVTLKSASST
jgi:hypothetical protein